MSELKEIKEKLWSLAGKHEFKWRSLLLAAWNLVCAVEDGGLQYALEKINSAEQYLGLARRAIGEELEWLDGMEVPEVGEE